jgi:hypothetical protein
MKKDVVIIHYNTQELTEAAIKSLNKTTKGCQVIVFDNSDRKPFVNKFDNVTYIDNTKGQIINFTEWLNSFPNKVRTNNDWASAKHCYSIHWFVKMRKNPFVLMDSDVLLKQDITALWDEKFAYIGEIHKNEKRLGEIHDRLYPYLCFVNVRMMKEHGVTFYNPEKTYALTDKIPGTGYDTGAWFVEDCASHNLPFKEITLSDYIVHLKAGSWKKKDAELWLRQNKDLWK